MNIVCRSLSVGYGPTARILDELDLHAASGEIVSLLGASGCGKSTLLRAVAGLLPIIAGEVLIGSQPTSDMRHQLSFVFQDATLLPWRTVHENVRLPIEIRRRTNDPGMLGRAIELLETVGFKENDFKKFPSELSGGMKMRASIARALVTDPSVLLLDEPFAALDDMLRIRMNELLIELWQQRPRTILFVTHNIAEAICLSHRIGIMSRGRIAQWIEVPLEFPRNRGVRTGHEFAELYSHVASRLEDSVVLT